jgi:hypothetical protein
MSKLLWPLSWIVTNLVQNKGEDSNAPGASGETYKISK